jgi:hypothetical protein
VRDHYHALSARAAAVALRLLPKGAAATEAEMKALTVRLGAPTPYSVRLPACSPPDDVALVSFHVLIAHRRSCPLPGRAAGGPTGSRAGSLGRERQDHAQPAPQQPRCETLHSALWRCCGGHASAWDASLAWPKSPGTALGLLFCIIL